MKVPLSTNPPSLRLIERVRGRGLRQNQHVGPPADALPKWPEKRGIGVERGLEQKVEPMQLEREPARTSFQDGIKTQILLHRMRNDKGTKRGSGRHATKN